MEAVNSVYKEVKKMFQTAVPPYVATVNDDYHYEVWAIKKQDKKRGLFVAFIG